MLDVLRVPCARQVNSYDFLNSEFSESTLTSMKCNIIGLNNIYGMSTLQVREKSNFFDNFCRLLHPLKAASWFHFSQQFTRMRPFIKEHSASVLRDGPIPKTRSASLSSFYSFKLISGIIVCIRPDETKFRDWPEKMSYSFMTAATEVKIFSCLFLVRL